MNARAEASPGEVTRLLDAWSAGDPSAQDKLLPLAYNELRQRAAGQLRRDRKGHTLQPTALVRVVRREDYVYLVPFVEDEHTVFLKTIIPSRKATKDYLGEESDHDD